MASLKKKMGASQRYLALNAFSFIAPFFAIYFIFNFFPILYSLLLSFHSWDGISAMKFVGLSNFERIFTTDPYFLMSIKNTVVLMLIYVPLSVVLGLLLANAVSSRLVAGRRAFQVVNYFPYIITPVAIGLLFSILFDWSSGSVNQLLMDLGVVKEGINWLGRATSARFTIGVMLIWKYCGYCMMLYLAGINGISNDLFEAARIDGANARQTFLYITIPSLRPITLFVTTTMITNGFQLFDEVKILLGGTGALGMASIGGPNRSCLTAVWNLYDTAFGFTSGSQRLGYGSAVAYGLFLFIVAVSALNYLFVQRKEMKGP